MSWTKRTPSKDPARHSENESSWAPRRDWQRGASPIPVSARWVCSAGAGSGRLRHQQPDNRSSAVIVSRDRRADRRFGVGLVANLAPAPIAMPVDHRAIAALAFSCRWRRGRRVPASGSAGFPDRCGDARGRYTRRHFPCAALPCREIRPVRDSGKQKVSHADGIGVGHIARALQTAVVKSAKGQPGFIGGLVRGRPLIVTVCFAVCSSRFLVAAPLPPGRGRWPLGRVEERVAFLTRRVAVA